MHSFVYYVSPTPPLGLGDNVFAPGVCLSHSCRLYNWKTVQAVFTKLHLNISQH